MPFIPASHTDYRSLYHYQPFNGEWKNYLEATLRDRTIYLSSPQSFNDPWDCRPWFDLEALQDPNVREAHIAWFMRQSTQTKESDAIEMRHTPNLLRHMIEECSVGVCNDLNNNYRVYCLTPNENNALMWAHYADKHKGICLQFDVRTSPVDLAYKIEYQQNLPPSLLIQNNEEPAIKALFTKSDAWAYENEFRILARDAKSPLPDIPITKDNLLKLADRVLIGIIIGCQSEDSDEIVEIVDRHQPSITVRKAVRMPHRYGLTFETLYKGRER